MWTLVTLCYALALMTTKEPRISPTALLEVEVALREYAREVLRSNLGRWLRTCTSIKQITSCAGSSATLNQEAGTMVKESAGADSCGGMVQTSRVYLFESGGLPRRVPAFHSKRRMTKAKAAGTSKVTKNQR